MKNRVVVITGATGGLGKAAAQTFAQRGASLALLDNNQTRLDELTGSLGLPETRLFARAADLRNAGAVRSAAEAVAAQFGRVDALIHLVGGWAGGRTIPEASIEEFESMLGQHAWTTVHVLQAFVPHLVRNGWGRVITVSLPLTVEPKAQMGPYAAGKAAQEALMLTLAQEFNERGLTANILHVRAIDVNGAGKGTRPDEIVAAMLYLCSDEAAKVNGARIPLYG